MDSQNTLESKLDTGRSSSSASPTLNELTSSEMKLENTSVPETQVYNGERIDSKEDDTPREVNWDGENDIQNPRNWPKWKKWQDFKFEVMLICRYVTLTVSLAILVANFGTSVVSPGLQDIATDFGINIEVGILGISLYLIGFGMSLHATCS